MKVPPIAGNVAVTRTAPAAAGSPERHRPVLITQNGRAASYLVDAESLDALLDSIELSRDIEISRREFAEGKGIPHEQVMRETREMLDRWLEEDKKRVAL